MLTEKTITKLRELRLSVMVNALKDQLEASIGIRPLRMVFWAPRRHRMECPEE